MGLLDLKKTPKQRGEQSQAYITARLLQAGYTVLIPYGDSARYDLVIEDGDGQFYRIQCKTGFDREEVDGGFVLATASSYYHTKKGRMGHGKRDYVGQVDYFGVYYPGNGTCYLVPAEGLPGTEAVLRFTQAKNKGRYPVRYAADYEL